MLSRPIQWCREHPRERIFQWQQEALANQVSAASIIGVKTHLCNAPIEMQDCGIPPTDAWRAEATPGRLFGGRLPASSLSKC
jgi:hypothetical protein